MKTLVARLFLILLFISCLSAKAEFKLNHTSADYKAWRQAARIIKLRQAIVSAANYVGVPENILLAVCFVESSHRELGSIEDGNTSSYGVCQVKLETAQLMDRVYRLIPITEKNLVKPWTNAYYAARYLKHQYGRYGDWNKAIDSYNKGHLVSEKSEYVQKVLVALQEERRK